MEYDTLKVLLDQRMQCKKMIRQLDKHLATYDNHVLSLQRDVLMRCLLNLKVECNKYYGANGRSYQQYEN